MVSIWNRRCPNSARSRQVERKGMAAATGDMAGKLPSVVRLRMMW